MWVILSIITVLILVLLQTILQFEFVSSSQSSSKTQIKQPLFPTRLINTNGSIEKDQEWKDRRSEIINARNPSNDLINRYNGLAMGAWIPTNKSFILEDLSERNQGSGISRFLDQGFNEYYFIMPDFKNLKAVSATEALLKAADETKLKIILILLPPSEGGPSGNYDWEGWINYFNSIKEKYPGSFSGFTIDDFNWISTRNDTRFKNNIDFMEYSKLAEALKHKRGNLNFYPVIYFEGQKTDVILNKYEDFINGIILVSGCYYNVSSLEKQLIIFRELFDNKPTRYVVYPTITFNYTTQNYSPPSDRLVMSTLSIASKMTNGLIVWHETDSPVIQGYLANMDSEVYRTMLEYMKELQIREEEVKSTLYDVLGTIRTESEMNCESWSNRFNYAYDRWFGTQPLQQQTGKQTGAWEKEMTAFVTR
jgi:hypothetical protein